MLYENQHAHMEDRLRQRAESRERQLRLKARQVSTDPFECIDEAVAQYKAEEERKRRARNAGKNSHVIHDLSLQDGSDSSDDDSHSSS